MQLYNRKYIYCPDYVCEMCLNLKSKYSKAVPLQAMEALGRRGGIAPTHSRLRH
jgi:hypothetical protein